MKRRFRMKEFKFKQFESIVNSYWDSLPENMQKELLKFYEEDEEQEDDQVYWC